MSIPSPQILSAMIDRDRLVVMGDGVPLFSCSRDHAIWLISRVAAALVRSA